jgi:uncharacterized protein (DUF433 family)
LLCYLAAPDGGGMAYIGQTRYKVLHLAAEHYHYGWSADELLRQHPDLRPEEVYAALTYFYDHYDVLRQQLTAQSRVTADAAFPQPLSRRALLARTRRAV